MNKSLIVVGGLLTAVLPWMSGGRTAVAVLISVFGLLVSSFLLLRTVSPRTTSSGALRFLAFAWVGWSAASLIWTVNRFQSEQWLLYSLIAIIVFLVSANLSLLQKEQAIKGYLWVALVISIYGFYLYLSGDYDRLTASFYWANPCAAFLLPAFLISGWKWITNRQWPSGLLTLCIGTAFWLTDSRGAVLVAAIVGVGCLALPQVRRRLAWIIGLGVVTFVLSFGVVAVKSQLGGQSAPVPGSRFAEAATGESMSAQDRISYLKSALEIWKDHPVLGSGAGTYGTVHPQYQQRVISAANDPHSIVAATLAEQGVVGMSILLGLAAVIAIGMWRGVRRRPQLGIVAISAIALALHFGLDIDSRYLALVALLAMLVGLTYQPSRRRPISRWRNLALPASLAAALLLSVSMYLSDASFQRGRIHDGNQDLTQAAKAYEQAHKYPIYDPDVWTSEGIDYYALAAAGGPKSYLALGRDRAKQAIRRDPKDSQHYFLLGRIERLDGNPPAALTAYHQALRLDRLNHPDYYVDLAALLIQQKNTRAARQVIRDGLALYPEAVIGNRNADSRIKPAVAELKRLQASLPVL